MAALSWKRPEPVTGLFGLFWGSPPEGKRSINAENVAEGRASQA